MLTGVYQAAMGMIGDMNVQDTLAQNIANAATTAYKRQIPSFGEAMASAGGAPVIGAVPRAGVSGPGGVLAPAPVSVQGNTAYTSTVYSSAGTTTDQSPGQSKYTGRGLDFALQGNGYFTLDAGKGTQVYTRDGNFDVGPDGSLVTLQGMKVLGGQGPIDVSGGNVTVTADGDVMVDKQLRGHLLITQFTNPDAATEVQGGIFSSSGVTQAQGVQVRQGYLETSNVNPVQEMVAMISSLRAYEAAQKVIQAGDSMLNKAANDIGRLA